MVYSDIKCYPRPAFSYLGEPPPFSPTIHPRSKNELEHHIRTSEMDDQIQYLGKHREMYPRPYLVPSLCTFTLRPLSRWSGVSRLYVLCQCEARKPLEETDE